MTRVGWKGRPHGFHDSTIEVCTCYRLGDSTKALLQEPDPTAIRTANLFINMILLVRKTVAAFAALSALAVVASAQSVAADNDEVIGRARDGYYNVTRKGFTGFKATIHPNWEVTLGPAATQQNLKVFRTLRFSMIVDASGGVIVTHEVVNPDKIRVEPYIEQIHHNVNRLVTSFFNTWSTFVVTSPFPMTDGEVKLQTSGNAYRLFFSTQLGENTLALTNDLLITEWTTVTPRGKRTVKPLFDKTSDGLLLNNYLLAFEPSSDGIRSTTDLEIEYQEFSGMQLPYKIRIKGMHGNEPIEAELEFNNYVLNPR